MVFHESGNKGEAWKEATVSIPASAVPNEYEIKIGASVGSSFKGDIALDDILIQDTSCAGNRQRAALPLSKSTFSFLKWKFCVAHMLAFHAQSTGLYDSCN
ncbi:hypothetical protein DPMN_096744 [Dreissena polymorpha]|uniref:MAM domain-containing protein n=1 Tax=Dreissena polymorpha TaxID=45954 RepID=A0A9D4R5Q3_DREPO|nr:hypothetical protein DPMN_096744 [Dreissena polymorpha]